MPDTPTPEQFAVADRRVEFDTAVEALLAEYRDVIGPGGWAQLHPAKAVDSFDSDGLAEIARLQPAVWCIVVEWHDPETYGHPLGIEAYVWEYSPRRVSWAQREGLLHVAAQ